MNIEDGQKTKPRVGFLWILGFCVMGFLSGSAVVAISVAWRSSDNQENTLITSDTTIVDSPPFRVVEDNGMRCAIFESLLGVGISCDWSPESPSGVPTEILQ